MSERWLSPGIRSPLTPSFSATTFAFPGVSPVSQTPFLPGMTHGNGIGHAVPDMKSPDLRPGSLTTQSLPVALDSTRNLGPFGMTTGPSPDGMGIEAGVDPLGIGLDAPLTQDGSLLGGIQASQTFSLPDNLSTMVDTLASSGDSPLTRARTHSRREQECRPLEAVVSPPLALPPHTRSETQGLSPAVSRRPSTHRYPMECSQLATDTRSRWAGP